MKWHIKLEHLELLTAYLAKFLTIKSISRSQTKSDGANKVTLPKPINA